MTDQELIDLVQGMQSQIREAVWMAKLVYVLLPKLQRSNHKARN